jgi:hypothetical protein
LIFLKTAGGTVMNMSEREYQRLAEEVVGRPILAKPPRFFMGLNIPLSEERIRHATPYIAFIARGLDYFTALAVRETADKDIQYAICGLMVQEVECILDNLPGLEQKKPEKEDGFCESKIYVWRDRASLPPLQLPVKGRERVLSVKQQKNFNKYEVFLFDKVLNSQGELTREEFKKKLRQEGVSQAWIKKQFVNTVARFRRRGWLFVHSSGKYSANRQNL